MWPVGAAVYFMTLLISQFFTFTDAGEAWLRRPANAREVRYAAKETLPGRRAAPAPRPDLGGVLAAPAASRAGTRTGAGAETAAAPPRPPPFPPPQPARGPLMPTTRRIANRLPANAVSAVTAPGKVMPADPALLCA